MKHEKIDISLPVNLPSVANFNNQNYQTLILQITNNAIVANAITPQIAEFRALQRLAGLAWIFQNCDALGMKIVDAKGLNPPEFSDLSYRLVVDLKSPCHAQSSKPSS